MAEAWPILARQFEGVCAWPYLDTVNKVTVGIGTLMDDGTGKAPGQFLGLPWTIDGRSATRAESASGWLLVDSRIDLAPRGGGAFRDVTRLRIADPVIDGLLMAKTKEFWSVLSAQLPGIESWPADAQLALLDMSYQLGPRFMGDTWPNFTAAAHAEDFAGCAAHCSVKQAQLSRNLRRLLLFRNAAVVAANGIAPLILWDARPPMKEDALTDDDLIRIRTLVRDELEEALPRIWDDPLVDFIADGNTKIRPKTALARLLSRTA